MLIEPPQYNNMVCVEIQYLHNLLKTLIPILVTQQQSQWMLKAFGNCPHAEVQLNQNNINLLKMASTKRYWPADLVLQLDICEGSCQFHGSKYPEGFVSDLPLNDSPPSQKG